MKPVKQMNLHQVKLADHLKTSVFDNITKFYLFMYVMM